MYARTIENIFDVFNFKDSYAHSKDPESFMDLHAAVSVVDIFLKFLTKTKQSTDTWLSLAAGFILAYAIETNLQSHVSCRAFFLDHSVDVRTHPFMRMNGHFDDDQNESWQRRGTLFCQLRLKNFASLPWAENEGIRWLESPESGRPAKAISLHRYLVAVWYIKERRRCLGLHYKQRASGLDPVGEYVIVRLKDGDIISRIFGPGDDMRETSRSLRRCEPGAGIAMFQQVIWWEVDGWAKEWRHSLKLLDKTFNIPVLVPSLMVHYSLISSDFAVQSIHVHVAERIL